MATPDYKYWRARMSDGSYKLYKTALTTTCADRPTAAAVSAAIASNPSLLVDNPTLAGYHLGAANCAIAPSAKFTELWIHRYVNNVVLVYAQGQGRLDVTLEGINGTPALANPTRTMTTNPTENVDNALFEGSKSHGAYFSGVPNGAYRVGITDEDGATQTFNVAVTDQGPVGPLYKSGSGDNPTTPDLSVTKREIIGPGYVSEANSGTYTVRETLSNNTVRTYSLSITWALVGAPGGVTLSSSGVLSVPADSLSADVPVTIRASFESVVLTLPVTLSNGVPVGTIPPGDGSYTGVLRIFGPLNGADFLDLELIEFDAANSRFRVRNKGTDKNGGFYEIDNLWIDEPLESLWFPCGLPILIKWFRPLGDTYAANPTWQPRTTKDNRRADPVQNTWRLITGR